MLIPVSLIRSVNNRFIYGINGKKNQYRPKLQVMTAALVSLSAGIMQLALLAPYNNLASSVAAALVPTLLTPKIHITDENDQTFSFGSDSNSLPMETNQQQGTVYWIFIY